LPTPSEHRAIAESVGWGDHFDWDSIAASLAGSSAGIVALVGDEAVGMGRIVGDGVHYFYLQDVIVHPDHADEGLGSQIVGLLLDWIAAIAPSEAFVGLFSSPEAVDLYREFRFSTTEMTGMHRFVLPA
jgi:GNAT superfamily N-acetyltransferase